MMLDEADPRGGEEEEGEDAASQQDEGQEEPPQVDVDQILEQEPKTIEPPPLPGSSEQRSDKGAQDQHTVGQKRSMPGHFSERQKLLDPRIKEFQDCEIQPLWHVYLAKKAASVVAQKAAHEAKLAWSTACMKYQGDCCKRN